MPSRFIPMLCYHFKMFGKLKLNQKNSRYLLDASLSFNLVVIMLSFLKY